MSNQVLKMSDKRQLGYAVEGEGKPVIYFHGTQVVDWKFFS